ncbi:MAG: cobalamin-dependent protein [Spirochaetaceae bacterium]|nr:cobalamin-dependent protein [Spirochaetaceae bacterium]
MTKTEACDIYFDAVLETDRKQAKDVVLQARREGISPEEIVMEIIIPSIDRMIEAFIDKRVILSQHFIATSISEELVEELLPDFSGDSGPAETVIIGCAAGDFHGLGKKIVSGCLKAHLFNVIDLGLNVTPERFVDEALSHNSCVIGVSSMMAHTAIGDDGAAGVRRILAGNGLEDRIKIIVGGAPYKFDAELYKKVGADDYALNGMEAVRKIRQFLGEAIRP